MKAVILAGGFGSRLSEETSVRPKPMIEIGGRPMLWHIMKLYGVYGVTDFIVCCGYKGYVIKEYFANYYLHACDVTLDLRAREMEVLENSAEPWRVTLVDTGESTQTGGRLRRVRHLLGDDDFFMTYGDGLANVDIAALAQFHREQRRLATVTAVQPPGRFGSLAVAGTRVDHFEEKPQGDGGWINGGFFVLSPRVLERVASDNTVWEQEPMISLARDGELSCFRHAGFWQPVDTLRDKNHLEALWDSGEAPWRVWR